MGVNCHYCEGHGEYAPPWVLNKTEDCCGLKKKQKEDEDRKKNRIMTPTMEIRMTASPDRIL